MQRVSVRHEKTKELHIALGCKYEKAESNNNIHTHTQARTHTEFTASDHKYKLCLFIFLAFCQSSLFSNQV